ncbi:hypothetical protein CcaverHIS002_0201790 [Cutaneotrichosporon cavernicola]|uniref:Cation efflux protein cytoplasmic domain-containing protein n=1 Tax=Cutaneotrichosporon cavernicola TaxID=279322 RepID=A0AA48L0Y2_9TREE|nr:uncharacterized protein CcaverHIS019_0201820 [Cutaneotrichosporon cavernicola]BEI81019.1 hypothetical protein CcaverHIS002_0201790 [Cutaneotrichosporon cavernicola]BEI88820.1 hypothetical protein CcaverHIS019_0201820 [Cutaneotrichosporon cavernicola]BEI96595.1 hypothetical protein CcaverHIS631_0201840 [Cutaneotrichosporon cavernicola]BEJ04367.1 hypothetical protein CcaverHIS641_0201840 [Cutaneotrichosporon cavernicola]
MSTETTMIETVIEPRSSPSLSPTPPLSPTFDGHGDIELNNIAGVVAREAGERDPLLLRDRIVPDEQLQLLRRRTRADSKVAKFYEAQNDHIGRLLKPMHVHTAEGAEAVDSMALKVKIAVNVSFVANIILAGVQLYAAISSMSIALFASCVDAVFDPFANLLLWLSHRAAKRANHEKWPMGGSRFETIGNIVYSFIMMAVNLILIVEAIKQFAMHKGDDKQEFHLVPLICVCIAWGVKFLLFLYCFAIRGASSQVQVLWEDHRNDLFANGFAILSNAGGAKLAWFIDPLGGSVIAIVIIGVWCRTAFEQFTFLGGITASPDYVSLVTYKAMTFSDDIKMVDTVRVYHSGPHYIVEVDIVLDPHMSLWRAHDISQDLQDQIEALPDVDRCFVHVDHEVTHTPEHRKTK